MKILTFTSLYPNDVRPHYGVFVEARLKKLYRSGKVEVRVIAPVPWVPPLLGYLSRYHDISVVRSSEFRGDIQVLHPRYLAIPKIGMTLSPFLMALSLYPKLKKIKKKYNYEIIDAHYFYPDGVAAALLGKWLSIPVVITARGTDINLIPSFTLPRVLIQWAAKQAASLVTVSASLKRGLENICISGDNIRVLRNGVDLEYFKPSNNRKLLRDELHINSPTLLCVGNLIESKGQYLVIESLKYLSGFSLIIVGGGPCRKDLEKLSKKLGVFDRVRFLGVMKQDDLIDIYTAVDALVLASSREGWPNVLLESMACGTPVIATRIDGLDEIVRSKEAGILIERNIKAIVDGAISLIGDPPSREDTRGYAEMFSWNDTTTGQLEIFQHALSSGSLKKNVG